VETRTAAGRYPRTPHTRVSPEEKGSGFTGLLVYRDEIYYKNSLTPITEKNGSTSEELLRDPMKVARDKRSSNKPRLGFT
jgi:hypothetical protein